MSVPTTDQMPAGWYPDPATPSLSRWWNGVEWTADTRAAAAPITSSAAPSGRNTPATTGLTFGILALVGVPIACILGLVFSIQGLSRSKPDALAGRAGVGRTKSIWGIALSVTGALVWTIIAVAVIAGQVADHADDLSGTYRGTFLAADVTQALIKNGNTVTDVTCPDTPRVDAGVITECLATLDGKPTGIRVTWDDAAGNFTLSEHAR